MLLYACLTASEFSKILPDLRPALLQMARQRHGASSDSDAEDLVSETVLIALHILPKFVPDHTEDGGLLRWLRGVMRFSAGNERKRARKQVPVTTVPIDAARNIPSPPAPSHLVTASAIYHFASLPAGQASMVQDWLDGYTQKEIARRHSTDPDNPMHRNTVGNRLELAFQTLRVAMPHAHEISYSFWLINTMSRHPVYHAPGGMSRRWFAKSPPDICFFRYRAIPAARMGAAPIITTPRTREKRRK